MTYFETRKKKKALSVKVLLQLPVRRCITRSGAPACARRGREPAPGSAVPCPAPARLPPSPPPDSGHGQGTGSPPRRGRARRGPARRAEPRGSPAGSPRDRAGHRAQSCPAGPAAAAGAPGVRSPGRPPVQSGDIATDICKRGHAGVRSRRRCETILDAGLALWLRFFFPLLPLSFSFQLPLFLDPRLSPPTERERERKKKVTYVWKNM